MSRELYRTNTPPPVGTTVKVDGLPYLITKTKTYGTEPWSTTVVHGQPTTRQGESHDLDLALKDLGRALDKALGLTRILVWLNTRLARIPGLRPGP